MSSLTETFPALARALSQRLRAAGRTALAEQVAGAVIDRVTFDDAANAGYIYVRPSREANVVDVNIVGIRHGETIEVETQYWTNIDTDNLGRLVGIEILAPRELNDELRRCAAG